MSQTEFLSTSSLTPKKFALIAVLVGVLGFVLFAPKDEGQEFDTPPSLRTNRAITKVSFQKSPDNLHSPVRWPDVHLEHVLATNPFETIFVKQKAPVAKQPKIEAPPVVAQVVVDETIAVEPKTTIEHRPHEEVKIIYENTSGRVAVIGSTRVRVGDVLPEGRVVEITPNHVIVAVEVAVDPESGESASGDPVLDEPALDEVLPEIPAA